MKKLTGILVVLFLMICSLAAAAGPEFRSNVSASKWLQVKDSVIDVTDKDGLILKVQWPVFSSKDDSHGHLIASLKKESDQLRSRDDARVLSLLEQSFHLDLAGERWGYEGLNYDAKTGKKLSSLDVFKLSKEELADTLLARLTKKYGRKVLGQNPRRMILSRIKDDSDMEFLPWIMTTEGVTIHFRSGDFHAGSRPLPITILFREEPELFNKKYMLKY